MNFFRHELFNRLICSNIDLLVGRLCVPPCGLRFWPKRRRLASKRRRKELCESECAGKALSKTMHVYMSWKTWCVQAWTLSKEDSLVWESYKAVNNYLQSTYKSIIRSLLKEENLVEANLLKEKKFEVFFGSRQMFSRWSRS